MESFIKDAAMSDDPTDTRRPLISGSMGEKYATEDSSGVSHQAPDAVNTPEDKIRISIRPKHRIGTWNVRGLGRTGKLTIVEKEMVAHNISILGICEINMKVAGHFKTTLGNTMYFSGHKTQNRYGVGIILPHKLNTCVTGYNAVNERIMTLRLDCKPFPLNIIQVYAPTAQSSDADIDHFYDKLQETISCISRRELLIVQGDWNAKVGDTSNEDHIRHIVGKYGLGCRNERGEKLIDFCICNNLTIANTCFQHHNRRLYTWKSPGDNCRNQIDYIAVSHRWKSSITNARTFPGADCGSDHQLLVADIHIRLKSTQKRIKPVKRISQAEANYFKKESERQFVSISQNTNVTSQNIWSAFKAKIIETLDAMNKKPAVRKDWITDQTWELIAKRKELKSSNTPVAVQEYSRLSKFIKKHCRRDKNYYIENICAEVEKHAEKHQTGDLFRKIRKITRDFKPHSWTIDDREGNPINNVKQAVERWKEYCEDLYKDQSNHVITSNLREAELEPDIILSEVEDAIRKLKVNKAPGPDKITSEVLKSLGPEGVKLLHKICNMVWKTCKWPFDWVHSSILPLHKKGSVKNCGNYRTIALISHTSKIMLHIINSRLRSYIDWQIPQEQAGFVKGKGTREQITNLRLIVEKCYEFNTPVLLCFVDYQKAFDFVRWQRLWETLHRTGVPSHMICLIRNLYEAGFGTISVGNHTSTSFKFQRGVRQGCVISPILFNIYGEHIMRKTLDGWEGGVRVGGAKISNLRYADDTTLLAGSEGEMAELLQRLEQASAEFGLSINKNKTKLMAVDRLNQIQRTNLLDNYETVQEFQYLGSVISNKGGCEREIRRRIGMAKTAMTQLTKIWKDHNISRNTKVYIIRTLVFPIFLYGSEGWTLKAGDRRRIDAFEMWCWRRMLRIPWTARRTNISILKELKLDTQQRLSTVCLHKILQYFGHIARRGTDNLEKLIITGKVDGKRQRGRSPRRWSDQVSEELQMPVSQALHQAQDRSKWRSLLQRFRRCHDPHQ